MENELTLEQAINNIRVVLDNFVGKKQDHLVLDKSFILLKNAALADTNQKPVLVEG